MNTKCAAFIKFFDHLVRMTGTEIPPDVQEFYDTLTSVQETTKPEFTEAGLAILEYLQNSSTKNQKAKDIADGMLISSRKVSGAIRKLVSDGYVEKFGSNPVIYSITEQGKQVNILHYKEILNNEED